MFWLVHMNQYLNINFKIRYFESCAVDFHTFLIQSFNHLDVNLPRPFLTLHVCRSSWRFWASKSKSLIASDFSFRVFSPTSLPALLWLVVVVLGTDEVLGKLDVSATLVTRVTINGMSLLDGVVWSVEDSRLARMGEKSGRKIEYKFLKTTLLASKCAKCCYNNYDQLNCQLSIICSI